MKTYQPADLRNFAIVGHASSGKTMLAEAMLMCGGVINRMGRIADGSTVSDYHVSEKHRKISVSASLLHTEWMGKKFNIIDTPGYLDFISEGLGALRVGDFALVVIHAQHGLGVGTDRVWNYATGYGLPKMIVVNALDKENVDFDEVLKAAREHFGRHVFPLSVPVNAGPGFNKVLDVLRNDIVTYAPDGSGKYTEEPVTGEWEAKAKELHSQLIEHIAESDDELMT
ncbi:MAG TPA: GTP-binding protein, partial [Verrucomicrobiae bacterium]